MIVAWTIIFIPPMLCVFNYFHYRNHLKSFPGNFFAIKEFFGQIPFLIQASLIQYTK